MAVGTKIAADELAGGEIVQYVKVVDGTGNSEVPLMVKAEDAAHTTGDTGLMLLAVRQDTAAALATTDGDYIPLIVSSAGRLWASAVIDTALPAGTNAIGKLAANSGVDIGDVDVTSLPALAAGSATVGAVRPAPLASITATFNRPANTDAYTAGDVVADSTSAPTVITFTSCALTSGGSGYITGAWLYDSEAPATAGQFELWLFTAAPGLDNDNAAFTPTDAEMLTNIAFIPFTLYHDGTASGNRNYTGTLIEGPIPFKCGADANLYGELVVRNAYAPVSGETFAFRLLIEQSNG